MNTATINRGNAIRILVTRGVRPTEIARAKVEDVAPEEKIIWLRSRQWGIEKLINTRGIACVCAAGIGL